MIRAVSLGKTMATTMNLATMLAVPGACSRYVDLTPPALAIDASAPDGGSSGRDAADGQATRSDGGPKDDAGDATSRLTCASLGTPIRFPTASGSTCTSVLAARGHRFALCSCGALDLPSNAPIYTDSFDSSVGGVAAGGSAAIGVGDALTAAASIRSGGALYVSSFIASAARIETAASLRVGAGIALGDATGHVAGDAYVNGAISGALLVDGVVHQPQGARMDSPLISETAIRREPVSVPPPCDCSSAFVDLPAAVTAAVAHNDNAIAGLSVDELGALGAPTTVNATCGTFVVSSINAPRSLVFAVHSRVLLAVTGDVIVRGGLVVVLDPDAELDLLIGGQLVATGGNPLGSASPARFRIWIAGSGPVVLNDAPTVGAIISAPNATVTATSGLQLSGALLAHSLTLGDQLKLHFDEAVASSGAPCGEPAATFVP
jgi:hypothetical protein